METERLRVLILTVVMNLCVDINVSLKDYRNLRVNSEDSRVVTMADSGSFFLTKGDV